MGGVELAVVITAVSGGLAGLFSFYRSLRKDSRDETVAIRSTALQEMESSLQARADDYHRLLAEILELKEEVRSLRNRVREELERSNKLVRENISLVTRITLLESRGNGDSGLPYS